MALAKFEQLLGKLEVVVDIMGGKSQTLQGLMA
jgi:hypothetical protein